MPLRYAQKAPEYDPYPLTIRRLLSGVLARAADQTIVYRDARSLTYREFFDRIGKLGSLLTELGAGHGTTVAVMDWDSHRYLECFFAVPMLGAVLQTVNVRLSAQQIAYTLQHADAEILIVHQDFLPMARQLPSFPEAFRAVIVIAEEGPLDEAAGTAGEYEALLADASPVHRFEDIDEHAVATTFYTSGTTGNPKGVSFTHRQLVLHSIAACGQFGASHASPSIGRGDVYMPLTPMFHVHAWGFPYVATMMGLKQVYPGRYDPDMICKLRRTHEVTYSHCVPTVLRLVLDAARSSGTDLSGWKMTIGGAAFSEALFAEARTMGMRPGAAYGMSETCPMILVAACPDGALADGDALAGALTASGYPIPLVEAEIVIGEMNALAHDGRTRGELVLRAPWLTAGYVGDDAASAALWRGGWLHTQDIATIDESGRVRIRDRLKDVIKSGGEWIDSIQLENLISGCDGILEAAVVAVPDPKWGERPMAVVVRAGDTDPDLTTINAPIMKAIADGAITPYARIDRMKIVPELPRTSVGKIDKKAIRAAIGN